MSIQSQNIQQFPLKSLHLSALNARQVKDPTKVQDLVPSIASVGVVQNLCVTPETLKGKKKPGFGVVAGGRRLLALQVLLERGDISADYPVSCEVVDASRAREISIAENTQREQMTPVEEVRAFASLAADNMPIEDIAARFGVTPLVVQRRLKLAAVSPKLLDLSDDGKISIEQLMALSVVNDHAKQEECWNTAPQWERTANGLRNRLLGGAARADSDDRMKFVTLKAYKKAGGTLTQDLFDTHSGYIDDPMLLDRLVAEKLEKSADALRAEGWQNVELLDGHTGEYELHNRHHVMEPALRELTAEEQAALDSLQAAEKLAQEALDAHELTQPDYEDEEAHDAFCEKQETLETEVERIKTERKELTASWRSYSDEQKAVGICFVGRGSDGKTRLYRGFVKRGVKAPNITDRYGNAVSENANTPTRSVHSEKVVIMLTSERSLALQAMLIRDPSLALVAVLEKMVPQVLGTGYGLDNPIKISTTCCSGSLLSLVPNAEETEAGKIVAAARQEWAARMEAGTEPGRSPLDWLLSLTADERNQLHAVCVACSLDARRHMDRTEEGDAFTRHAGLDMTQWWKPTADRYFAHVGKPQILTALTEAGLSVEGLDKLKKAELAGKAEALMAEAGASWLPGPLRG